MKKTIKLIAFALVLVMTVTMLAACGDKSGAIKSAFEKEGYTVEAVKYDKLSKTAKGIIEDVLGDELAQAMAQYEILVCTKVIPTALVIKFPSEGDIKTALTVEDDASLYDELKNSGFINGNCLLLTILPGPADIFKNA